jgi:hypothetical protein
MVVFVLLFLSGCSLLGRSSSVKQTIRPNQSADRRNGIEDPYYKEAWEGLQKADKQYKLGIEYVKTKSDKDYQAKLAELSQGKTGADHYNRPWRSTGGIGGRQEKLKVKYTFAWTLRLKIRSRQMYWQYRIKLKRLPFWQDIWPGRRPKPMLLVLFPATIKRILWPIITALKPDSGPLIPVVS